ncbi:MAG: adenylate/guanylate cyclase domain-containing protein [Rhodoferax sp.]|nr:adenylate/guanylate cyclase domain-containing protein [Rhodoferax sp.]
MSSKLRIFLVLLGGNLGGALLVFVHLRFLDPFALDQVAPLGWREVAFFIVAFSTLLIGGRAMARRYASTVLRATGPLPDGPAHARARRRAVQLPGFLAALSMVLWVLAAFVWGFFWPWLIGNFNLQAAARQAFGMALVAGPTVGLFVFLATERIWRERLPLLFPRGDLAASGARNWRVRTRMLVVFLFASIVPLLVMAVATTVRVRTMRGADIGTAAEHLQDLIIVQGVLVATGLLLAIVLARFLADSVSAPLRELQAAMVRVERGDLQAHCAVVSNDEIGAVTAGFNHMVDELRDRELIHEAFGRYVSPEIRDEILSGRTDLTGDQRDVTIVFADLRGFTTWVEASPATEVVEGLNAYFTEMEQAVRAHGGLVLQFIGDEIEAVFGAPLADEQHADHAVAAVLEMQQRLEAWNAVRLRSGLRTLDHGIGIHSGTVVAGNIGSTRRMSYALVGDAVNVASRIESLNKQFGSHILVSGATRERLRAPVPLQALPAVRVKGRSAEVEVYRLA